MNTSRGNPHARWKTVDGMRLAREVFERLTAGQPLHDLKLGEHEGRIDLRGIHAPEVTFKEIPPSRNWSLQKLHGCLELRNIRLDGIDFSGSWLKYFRFFDSQIANCCFDDSDCGGWGLWSTNVTRSTFIRSSLRESVLGPWYQGRGNTYKFVDFSWADLRGLVSTAATYVDCDFGNAKLEKIEFQSSSFIRCHFAGKLREVIFYDHGFKTGKPDPNPMEDVDFSDAQLRWVEFRRLNLDRVRLPEDNDHLVITNYQCVLNRALAILKDNENQYSQPLRAILELALKWMGPKQQIGVFCRLDFQQEWGKEGEEFAVNLLRRAERDCWH